MLYFMRKGKRLRKSNVPRYIVLWRNMEMENMCTVSVSLDSFCHSGTSSCLFPNFQFSHSVLHLFWGAWEGGRKGKFLNKLGKETIVSFFCMEYACYLLSQKNDLTVKFKDLNCKNEGHLSYRPLWRSFGWQQFKYRNQCWGELSSVGVSASLKGSYPAVVFHLHLQIPGDAGGVTHRFCEG